MFNSLYIFILRLNREEVTEGQFFLALAELAATVITVAIIRNT